MNLIQYLSLLLSEECNEIAQRASKMSRFGVTEVQSGQPHDNMTRVQHEKTDFLVVYALLLDASGAVDPDRFFIDSTAHRKKIQKIKEFTALSVKQGMISKEVEKSLLEIMPF